MESLLNFEVEFDVGLYDQVVAAFFAGRGDEAKQAKTFLEAFQENPESWTRVPDILERSQNPQSKYIGLQILEKLITTRWKTLPEGQRQGIRNFIVSSTVKVASDEVSLKKDKAYIGKLNLALIQILKQEWPHNWPTFIPELVESSKTNLSLCENNMAILKLLSEEVFDFSTDTMTSAKIAALKQQMWDEFSEVFKLCNEILQEASKVSLIRATLETLYRFLGWIPLGFIFETPIIDLLTNRFLAPAEFRNISLRCLAEIASLPGVGQYANRLTILYTSVMTTITTIVPPSTNFAEAYASSSSDGEELVLNLALFLSNFFTNHLAFIEDTHADANLLGHAYLVKISAVEEREIFKICIEYWIKLLAALYNEQTIMPISGFGISFGDEGGMGASVKMRKDQYAEILSNLRLVVIERMVKPEEVLIVENDEGEIVREHLKEIDTIVLYKSMREVLIYLTHLDVADTEMILTTKLSHQVDGTEWSWANLNTLCWAIGSISGSMGEEQEKRFLVGVIKDLLGLVEMKRGKDNKAVVASNIMYIVGQYPRFLKAHWKFLKTVVNKLFEFMHETHEGVQDMACDTFIKIAQKCRRHFVMQQSGEREPFINEILRGINRITVDLSQGQIHTVYEAIGYMIAAQPNRTVQESLLVELMAPPNGAWDALMSQAAHSADILASPESIKMLSNILKSNTSACTSIGAFFLPQLGRNFVDMLGLYKAVSGLINGATATEGPIAARTPKVRQLRTVKKDVLKLMETYIQRTDDAGLEGVNSTFVPPLLDAILGDYQTNVPTARDAEVLGLMTVVINRLQGLLAPQIIPVLEAVFEPTLAMITQDFTEFPEHRLWFYRLLEAIEKHCFSALLLLQPEQFKTFMNSIFWGIKHTMRDIADIGLNILFDLILKFSQSPADISTSFFTLYHLNITQEIFFVLTDSEHKSGFTLQTAVLARLFHLADGPLKGVPVFAEQGCVDAGKNREWLQEYVGGLLSSAFAHVQRSQINEFTARLGLFYNDATNFKGAVRDFLIQLKEFSEEDMVKEEKEAEAAKRAEEERERAQKIPGMLKPDEMKEEEA